MLAIAQGHSGAAPPGSQTCSLSNRCVPFHLLGVGWLTHFLSCTSIFCVLCNGVCTRHCIHSSCTGVLEAEPQQAPPPGVPAPSRVTGEETAGNVQGEGPETTPSKCTSEYRQLNPQIVLVILTEFDFYYYVSFFSFFF